MKKAKSLSFELVRPGTEIPLHNLYHRRAALLAAQGVGYLVLAGLQLAAEKKKLKHGEWSEWVEGNCDYDIRTAQKYIGLGEGVKGRALKNERDSFFKLLEVAPSELKPADQEKLVAAVNKLIDGETLGELYQGFGILKLPAGSGLRGLKRKHTPSSGEDDEAQAAVDIWQPLLRELEEEGLEKRSWKDLPQSELARLREAVRDLGRLVKSK